MAVQVAAAAMIDVSLSRAAVHLKPLGLGAACRLSYSRTGVRHLSTLHRNVRSCNNRMTLPAPCQSHSRGTASSSSSQVVHTPSADAAPLAAPSWRPPPGTLSEEDEELLESLDAAVLSLGDDAADHPLLAARDSIVAAYRDKAALLKRDWTDEMFQEGEDMNEERVTAIEAELVASLASHQTAASGLKDGVVLGSALDLVGVYMKNYKLDKADAVLARCGPHVSDRGGVWMVKWLNHISTVRMKQGRSLEALEMLYDLELYSPYNAGEAPEFFETLYRNLAWALKALGRIDDACVYFEKMTHSSKSHKGALDWFDCWDLGKLLVARAYRDKDMPAFYRGRAMVEDALRMHIASEPEDLVMRAKVQDSLAECFLIVEDFTEATEHYDGAYRLMLETVGPNSPLFGKQARHSATLQSTQGNHAAAIPFLQQALAVEAGKDAVKVLDVMGVVDQLVNTLQKAGLNSDNVSSNNLHLKLLQRNLKARGLDTSREYGVLAHKMSLLYLHESQRSDADGHAALKRARRLAKSSVRLLRMAKEEEAGGDGGDWLQMTELHLRMLSSASTKRPS